MRKTRYIPQTIVAAMAMAGSAWGQTPAPTPPPPPAPANNTANMQRSPAATPKPSSTPAPAPAPAKQAAKDSTDKNADTAGSDADIGVPLKAKVIEVEGSVEYAIGDVDPVDLNAWKPVVKDMELGANTQIRTGMRSKCTLQFGEKPNETIIQLRRATLAKIADYRRTIDEQRIRIGLGYGAVRGGSTEGTLRSDVVVDSTVATLAKRGTEGWEIEIEPVSGTFRISLAKSGLVEAFSDEEQKRRRVHPGEYATDENVARMWINQDIFNRAVQFYEPMALSFAENAFLAEQTTGYGNLGPLGNQLYGFAGRRPIESTFPTGALPWLRTVVLQPLPVQRAEGNFGFGRTFRVLVPRSD